MRRSMIVFSIVIGCGALGAMACGQLRILRELDTLRAADRSLAESPKSSTGAARASLSESDRLRRLELAVAAAAARAVPSGEPPAPAEAAKAAAPKRMVAAEEAQANVLTAYAKEASDPAWSREASQTLDASVRRALPPGSRLRSVDCRATLCLVEVEHPDPRVAASWLLPGFRDWTGAVFLAGEREEQGTIVQTLVPIRQGTTPPYAGL
jgi:hypothetical protein